MQLTLLLVATALAADVRRATSVTRGGGHAEVSPIAKVLELLQSLQAKVAQDGAVEEKQYLRFQEWCEDEAVSKKYEIQNAQDKAEALGAAIEKEASNAAVAAATIEELGGQVTKNRADLDAATKIREKEAADFEAKDKELAETIDMIGRAITILERELKPALLQSKGKQLWQTKGVADVLRAQDVIDALQAVLQASAADVADQAQLSALLQNGEDDDFLGRAAPDAAAYESHSGQILETLEDMKDKAAELRHEGQKAEMNAKHAFNMLAQSLKDALKTDGADFDAAKIAQSTAQEAKATAEGDLAMTQKVVAEAQEYMGHVNGECQQKASDFTDSSAARAAELKALAEARRVIEGSTGAATDRTYGFVQATFRAPGGDVAVRAAKLIQQLGSTSHDAEVAQLGARITAAVQMSQPTEDVFAKVRAMIEEMVAKLMAQAADEADHKAWCDKEMGSTQGKVEGHQSKIEKLAAKIDTATAGIAQLAESIQHNQEALSTLTKHQAEMTAMRTSEKEEFEKLSKDYEEGIAGLGNALAILRDYYAKAAENTEPALVQQPIVGTHTAGDASGIIGLLEVAESDFTKMLADAKVQEETAAKAYEDQMHEMDVDKAMKDADIKYESKEKTATEKLLNDLKVDRQGEQDELDAVGEYFKQLAPACTTKPLSYDERKERRESEIAGLREALAILEGGVPAEAFLAVRRSH